MPAAHPDLIRRWTHSHEEDSPDGMVFRPSDHAFPPSRGRASFELFGDQKLVEHDVGANDAGAQAAGRWSLMGKDELAFFRGVAVRPTRRWRIVVAEKDRLVLKGLEVSAGVGSRQG